jgi:proteasome alpha subunit
MMSPFDWQGAMSNRVEYIGSRIEKGSPVLALSIEEGIILFTYRRTSRKLFEVYDRLGFGGLGQQSDVEAIRVMAVEFAHKEGYSRSEKDVTVWRVVTSVSAPIKQAFSDFSASPVLAISLFAELGDTPEHDQFYTVDLDGDYQLQRGSVVLSGRNYGGESLHQAIPAKTKASVAVEKLKELWMKIASDNGEIEVNLEGLRPEVVLMERAKHKDKVWRELE